MSVNKVKKVELIVHNLEYQEVVSTLQECGVIHIDYDALDSIEKNNTFQKKSLDESEDFYRSILYSIDKLIQRAKNLEVELNDKSRAEIVKKFFSSKEHLSRTEFNRLIENTNFTSLISEIERLLEREKTLLSENEKLLDRIKALTPLENLSIPVSYIADTENVAIRLFVISKSKFINFKNGLDKDISSKLFEIYLLNEVDNNIYFIILSFHNIFQDIYSILRKNGGEEFNIIEKEGLVSEIINRYKNLINKNKDELSRIKTAFYEIIELHGKSLKAYYDDTFAKLMKLKNEEKFISTDSTRYLVGWLLEKNIEKLSSALEKFDLIFLKISDPAPDDNPPVSLSNPSLVEPYEMLTELYSLPKYREIDPTPLISWIFPILFGICLGDAGYGVVLFFGSLLARKQFKTGVTRQLIDILLQSGVWTVVFGIITGSYFGTRLDLLAVEVPYLYDFIMQFTVFVPLNNPMKLLVLALQIGIFQVSFSFGVAMYLQIKAKNYLKAFTQTFAYIVITITGSLLVSSMFGFYINPNIKLILGICSGLSLASLLIFSANTEKSAFEKGLGKFFAVYNVAGIMGDILSYSRLLALGLSSSVIAMVANIVAQLIRGSKFNPISWLFSVVVLVAFHALNIALNCLGGFVHSMRLQFVEFFKNFYEGGGKPFLPFKRIYKYSIIVED